MSSGFMRQVGIVLPEAFICQRFHRRLWSRGVVLPFCFSSSASSASISRMSSDSANVFCHFASEWSSSRSHYANAFCSTSGRFSAVLNALVSDVVMLFFLCLLVLFSVTVYDTLLFFGVNRLVLLKEQRSIRNFQFSKPVPMTITILFFREPITHAH